MCVRAGSCVVGTTVRGGSVRWSAPGRLFSCDTVPRMGTLELAALVDLTLVPTRHRRSYVVSDSGQTERWRVNLMREDGDRRVCDLEKSEPWSLFAD
jgi:hypothetical protein